MRIWSLHPRYLDAKGLVALWRETLLAQKVLLGETRGYRNHPQLQRFRAQSNPLASIAAYLSVVADEADRRGYRFDRSKIVNRPGRKTIPVTRGQLDYETEHLRKKLLQRDPERIAALPKRGRPETHPLFVPVDGPVESWEVV